MNKLLKFVGKLPVTSVKYCPLAKWRIMQLLKSTFTTAVNVSCLFYTSAHIQLKTLQY